MPPARPPYSTSSIVWLLFRLRSKILKYIRSRPAREGLTGDAVMSAGFVAPLRAAAARRLDDLSKVLFHGCSWQIGDAMHGSA